MDPSPFLAPGLTRSFAAGAPKIDHNQLSTIEITPRSFVLLHEMAAESGNTIAEIVDTLVRDRRQEEEFRARFIEETIPATTRLRADPEAWAEYQREMREIDAMGGDGLAAFPLLGEFSQCDPKRPFKRELVGERVYVTRIPLSAQLEAGKPGFGQP